jgi:uncharacterized protein
MSYPIKYPLVKNNTTVPNRQAGFWARCLFVLFCLIAAGQIFAQVPERPNPPHLVNDLAGMLSEEEAQRLEYKLVALDDSTGNQIAILTVPNLNDNDISAFANEVFNNWGIGHKDKNNGILILLARDERKSHIEVGYGLEGAIPDVVCKRILQDVMKPLFKQGQFYEGLHQGTDILAKLSSGEYKASDYASPKKYGRGKAAPLTGMQKIIGFIVLLLILWAVIKNPWLLLLFMNSGGRRGGGGFGDFSGGRGDFGGFGGGSSGGGGASGDW